MSLSEVTVNKKQTYTDVKYGCDVVVEKIALNTVLIKEVVSGNNHLYPIESFMNELDNRFKLKKNA